ncbi:hypothetical protein BHE74_00045404 [Ensete ventricosum]|nr:hypothetical protein BHE74_00045404 [Ensete ventricosum]
MDRSTRQNCLAEDPRMVITAFEGRRVHSPPRDEDESQPSSEVTFFWQHASPARSRDRILGYFRFRFAKTQVGMRIKGALFVQSREPKVSKLKARSTSTHSTKQRSLRL